MGLHKDNQVIPFIESLLERPEGETLDFKATSYDLSDSRKKRDFAKDLACLANTPRECDAHIVLGVKKRLDGSVQLYGIDKELDDANLQGVATSLLDTVPRFLYQAVPYGDLVLGLVTIPTGMQSPIVPKRTVDPGFMEGRIYFRRGSQNDVASLQDQRRIWAWLSGESIPDDSRNPYANESAWTRYLMEVNEFSPTTRHILVGDDRFQEDAQEFSGIGAGPWSFVFDFNTRSDVDGLLASMKETVERYRSLHIRVKGDARTSRSPVLSTTWFFIRGLQGRVDSLATGSSREWMREYRNVLIEECGKLAAELAPATVHATILWRDDEFSGHLAELLRGLDSSLHDSFRPVFVTDAPESCKALAEDFDAPVIEMPLQQFATGIEQVAKQRHTVAPGSVVLPSTSGVPIQLTPEEANWIAEEIELVSLGVPDAEDSDTFLRGGTATWADLDHNIDARRDIQTHLTEAIRHDLDAGRITRVTLFHRPGAGGTTVGRRAVWELHEDFPCGLLRRTVPMETAERVARIHELTDRPVLLIADGADVAERELDQLAEYLGARRTPVVLVQVMRRQEKAIQQGDRSFDLDSKLSLREVSRFVHALSQDAPELANAIGRLGNPQMGHLHRPVYFALTAYGNEFRGLPEFVISRIEGLSDEQRRVLVYAAFAMRYGQRALPASSLRDVFGLTPSERIDLPSLFPPSTNELFVEIAPGNWRIGHSLVAEELLMQLLAIGGDVRTWRNSLADWGIRFIEFCRGYLPVASNEMLELVRRVFVYRDSLDVLGREQSGQSRFSNFIQEVPVSEGKVRVLNALVESYPEEHHFWAHLARLHAMERRDFPQALEAADYAVQLADNDSVVYHMRGMVRRYLLRELQQGSVNLGEMVDVAERASSDFERSRKLNPENEHGYIAEAQMLIELLEHVGQSSGDLFQFLARRDAPPYLRESFDRIEGLLAHVKRDREGVGASQYETRASARVHSLYGDYTGAIQMLDSLTTRLDIYQPPVRRQLAWAYLARAGGDWSRVPKRNLDRVVELLTKNLEEEAQQDQNVRLWMQASRFQEVPPSVESIFEQVQYWRADPGAVDAAYYAYVLSALLAMDGSVTSLQRYEQYLEECRELTRFRRNRSRSYEWLGDGPGISRLVHQSRLGDWDHDAGFWENAAPLARVLGRVAQISGPQAGYVELEGGLRAFFVPARSGFSPGSENTPIRTFLGFSYDGLRAWDVTREERT